MLFAFKEELFHVEVNKLCKNWSIGRSGVFVRDSYKTLQILQWPS